MLWFAESKRCAHSRLIARGWRGNMLPREAAAGERKRGGTMRLPVPKRLRDLSLRHKILLANFLMVLVPVLLIAVLGTLLLAGLRFTGTLRQAELALLWPERGPAMAVSYAVSSSSTRRAAA